MKVQYIIIIILIILIIGYKTMKINLLLKKIIIRGNDVQGSGKFGATRHEGGKKFIHQGTDFIIDPGEPVFAPDSLKFIRIANPYKNDNSYNGGLWEFPDKSKLKIFYVKPLNKKNYDKGEIIAYTQNIAKKFDNMVNHIHVELRDKNNNLLNPENYI